MATKSTLVLRDGALLDEIGRDSWCSVSFTVTTVDESTARFLDNRSPPPAKRLEALRELKQSHPHILAGVLAIPLVPYFADDDASLDAVVAASKDAGADYLLFGGGMSLRDGQASYFLSKLMAEYPQVHAKYQTLYGFRNDRPYDGRGGPPQAYLLPKQQRLLQLCSDHDLPVRIPRFIPEDWRGTNYRVAERLLNEAYLRQMRGQGAQNLFWAGQNIQNLREPIDAIAARDELETIRNVRGEAKEAVMELLA